MRIWGWLLAHLEPDQLTHWIISGWVTVAVGVMIVVIVIPSERILRVLDLVIPITLGVGVIGTLVILWIIRRDR